MQNLHNSGTIHMLTVSYIFNRECRFFKPIEWVVLKKFFITLKKTACISGSFNCGECSFQKSCCYYRLSGRDFALNAIPIGVEMELLRSRYYEEGNRADIRFRIVGNAVREYEFISVILCEILPTTFGKRSDKVMYVIEQEIKECSWDNTGEVVHDRLFILETPMQGEYLKKGFDELSEFKKYYDLELDDYYNINDFTVDWVEKYNVKIPDSIKLNNVKVMLNGMMGGFRWNLPAEHLHYFAHLGLGRYNYLGLGRIKEHR